MSRSAYLPGATVPIIGVWRGAAVAASRVMHRMARMSLIPRWLTNSSISRVCHSP